MSKKKRRGGGVNSSLDDHRREGKRLVPPMMNPQIPWAFSSWSDERLPEMLWAALLVVDLGRVRALKRFREIANHIFRLPDSDKYWQITHTAIGQMPRDAAAHLIAVIAREERVAKALSPLLLLEKLPARDLWEAALSSVKEKQSWSELGQAVLVCYDHQSQEATDCRWLKMLVRLVAGHLLLPSEEMIRELAEYPSYGDQRRVRPSVRAGEVSVAMDDPKSDWPSAFWTECLEKTYCHPLEQLEFERRLRDTKDLKGERAAERRAALERAKHLADIWGKLGAHAIGTQTMTAVDPRHDAIFGIALYALTILHEISTQLLGRKVLGRVGMRVIAECHITLAYLTSKNDPELWRSWRVHGAGQAKLALLKFLDTDNPPAALDLKVLRQLANEDAWQEFLPINLGHWESGNLRDMSITAGVKEDYDRYYPWPSSYAHGQWGAVRDTVLDTCVNSLHRFHRIPRFVPRELPDCVADAVIIVNSILELVAQQYPNFAPRVARGG